MLRCGQEGGLAERLPLCWEIKGGWEVGFLFQGGPKSVPEEPQDYKTEIEPVD